MPDISVFTEKLQKVEELVKQQLPDIAILITLSTKAIVERKIKDQGFGKLYSSVPVPAWFFKDKELNKAGELFVNNAISADENITWKALRSAQGLPIDFVDLTYSGQMWSNMAPGEVEIENGIYRSPLAATNIEAQNKMNWNFERYGDFLGAVLEEDDYRLLYQIIIDEIAKIFNQIGIE